MRIFLVLTFLFRLTLCVDPSSYLFQELNDYTNITTRRARAAYQVVDKIYNSFRQWFFTIIFCEFTHFENMILKYTETYNDGYPVFLLSSCPQTNRVRERPKLDIHGETAYVVSSHELSLDNNDYVLDAITSTGVFKPRSAVIFVLNNPIVINGYFLYEMKMHFQLLWSRSITNSILVFWSAGRLHFFGYNPFKDEIQDITEVEDISDYLARIYDDLNGHELRVSVFRKYYIYGHTNVKKCDTRLERTVIEKLNATCLPLAPRDGHTVGDLLENGTATGATADVMDGYVDMELNSRILKNTYFGYIDTTYPLTQNRLCFMVKKSTRQSTFTTTLVLISQNILIMCMCNVVLLITVTLLVRRVEMKSFKIESKQSTSSMVLDLVKCFIRQTVDIKFMGPVFRFMALLIMVYSVIIDCAIDGILISAITYPRYKPELNTLEELKNTNLTLAIHNRNEKIFKDGLTPDLLAAFENRIELVNDVKIKNIIDERRYEYATLLPASDIQRIINDKNNLKSGVQLFHMMTECPLPCAVVYGLRYGSPYLKRLNKILGYLYQGGVLNFWSSSEDFSQGKAELAANKERKALTTTNLFEIFVVWFIGIIVSIIAFIFEIFLKCGCKNKEKVFSRIKFRKDNPRSIDKISSASIQS